MNYIDIVLIILLIISAIKGFRKGLIHQLASLLAWVIGIFLAVKLSKLMVPIFHPQLISSVHTAKIVAFLIVFVGVAIAILFVGKMVERFFEDLDLSGLNRIAGSVFSMIKTSFILSIIMVLLHISIIQFNWPSEQAREKSYLYKPIESFAPNIFPYLVMKNTKWVKKDTTLKP